MWFWEWLKSLFIKDVVIPSDANSEKEESPISKTFGVPVKSATNTISSGVDPDEAQLPFYYRMYNAMALRKGTESVTINAANTLLRGRSRYEAVEKATGVPWFIIGCIHLKECSGSFLKVLHNGELLSDVNRRGTTLVPAGYGKGLNWTWEQAAIHAITLNGGRWAKIRAGAKDIASLLYACERYNGMGHVTGAGKLDVSPYIWDGTNVYDGVGRYTSDGKWDATFKGNKSAGIAGILRYLEGIRAINIAAGALQDVGPIPQSPLTGNDEIGAGLVALAEQQLGLGAEMERLIAFQKKDRPGKNPRYWALFDVSLHSSKLRFYIFDRLEKSIQMLHVAHGSGSDPDHNGIADRFSNTYGSHMTSLGCYRASETYIGKNGLSCKLDGKEATNSNARARAVVIHGSSYVEPDYIQKYGKAGRSQGCPAVAHSVAKEVIQKLANGSPLLIMKGTA